MSNFSATAKINDIAGNTTNAGWEALESQIALIEHELKELKDGIAARNIHELRDGIADVLFTTYGLGHRAGIPVDLDYLHVCHTQYTKFDTTLEGAKATRDKYLHMGVVTYCELWDDGHTVKIDTDRELDEQGNLPTSRVVYYVTKSALDQLDHRGKLQPKGKWLKAVGFMEPSFVPLTDEATKVLLQGTRTNVYHEHLDACPECRKKVMLSTCPFGPVFLKQQATLTARSAGPLDIDLR